jgi:hypothetical protein
VVGFWGAAVGLRVWCAVARLMVWGVITDAREEVGGGLGGIAEAVMDWWRRGFGQYGLAVAVWLHRGPRVATAGGGGDGGCGDSFRW